MRSDKRTWRFYALWTGAVFLVIILFFHGTSPQSREYIKNLMNRPETEVSAEDAFEDPLAIDLVESPPEPEEPAPTTHFIETPTATSADRPADAHAPTPVPSDAADQGPGYMPDKVFFEYEVPYVMPSYDLEKLVTLAPHNYRGPGHKTFATFFLSRNESLHDPYYIATHQVVYRLLWNEESKSHRHPVVVFVAPFVTQEQRMHFRAAGAIVREVAQLPFVPNAATTNQVAHRLRDVFSKLEMWNQTDFTRIAYLDSDAFPLVNVDALLGTEISPDQKCKPELLKDEDRAMMSENICDYVFTGIRDGVLPMMNAGVMVLRPNEAMHNVLVREYHHQENFNNGFVEQALLAYVFREDGPFPPNFISDAWNGDPQVKDDGRELYILHAKLWAWLFPDHWALPIFGDTWKSLKAYYESEEFMKMREQDAELYSKIGHATTS